MYNLIRVAFILLLWLLSIIIFYHYGGLLCLAGLCDGPVASRFIATYNHIIILNTILIITYPFAFLLSQYYAYKYANEHIKSFIILSLPLLWLTPLFFQHSYLLPSIDKQLSEEYQKRYRKQYTIRPSDYVCASGRLWIRLLDNTYPDLTFFAYFYIDQNGNVKSDTNLIYKELNLELIQPKNINTDLCRQGNGTPLTPLLKEAKKKERKL